MACRHCPNKFANAATVLNLHQCFKFALCLRILGTNRGIELLKPCAVSREKCRSIRGGQDSVKPGVQVFGAEFINVCMAVDFNVMLCLSISTPLNISSRPCHLMSMVSCLSSMFRSILAVRSLDTAIAKLSTWHLKIIPFPSMTSEYKHGLCTMGARPMSHNMALVCFSQRRGDSGWPCIADRTGMT